MDYYYENRHEKSAGSMMRNLKRKSEVEYHRNLKVKSTEVLDYEVRAQVAILNSTSSSTVVDRERVYRSIRILSDIVDNSMIFEEDVNLIVECGTIPVLVRHLQAPQFKEVDPLEHQVEGVSAFTLGLLCISYEHKELIVDAGAIPHLVELLKRRNKDGRISHQLNEAIRNAAATITKLAYQNGSMRTPFMVEGGIPPLVELLEFNADAMVQISALKALRILSLCHDGNKSQIVDCNALPILILMLRSEVSAMAYEAVCLIANLVYLSPKMTNEVLLAEPLQPLIEMLSSICQKNRQEAALLLGEFADDVKDCKAHVVQRGAIGPLIANLQSPDARVNKTSADTLGILAKDTHNQAGIVHGGAIPPLLKLLDSGNRPLIRSVTVALYDLTDDGDCVVDLIKNGGVQILHDGKFMDQYDYPRTQNLVAKTLKKLEDKIHGRVLSHLLYLMRIAEKSVQIRVVLAFALLCSPHDLKTIFIDSNGLDILFELLESAYFKDRRDSCVALCELAEKDTSLSPVDAQKPSPISQVPFFIDLLSVCCCYSIRVDPKDLLSKYYVIPFLADRFGRTICEQPFTDVTFVLEGKRFYAHRVCLVASSDAFRAMFDGGYKEKDAKYIIIPNIRWDVFESMMRYIYTGSIDVNLGIAQDLFRAADQYLLKGLKRHCEYTIAQDINVDNVSLTYDLSEDFNAVSLRNACILFDLKNFDTLHAEERDRSLIKLMLPEMRDYFVKACGS